jgi:hypothetical protein
MAETNKNQSPSQGSPAWEENIRKSFEKHSATPTVSPESYFNLKSLALKIGLSRKTLIYFDTCHWVNLRHVVLKTALERSGYREILNILEKLREQKRICCPISFFLFDELMKQNDPITRVATARLMDRFSDGVCFQFPPHVARFELREFLLKRIRVENATTIADSVWTKAGFLVGELLPTVSSMPDNEHRLMQKAWIDEVWAMSSKSAWSFWRIKKNWRLLPKTAERIRLCLNREYCWTMEMFQQLNLRSCA